MTNEHFHQFLMICQQYQPHLAVVLGSGLNIAFQDMPEITSVSFSEIEGVRPPTVPGHHGRFQLIELGSKPIVVQTGRLHFYEGCTPDEVSQPLRAIQKTGISHLLLTNAAGSLQPTWVPGGLVQIRQDFFWQLGDRFQKLFQPLETDVYSSDFFDLVTNAANAAGLKIPAGVYCSLPGPCYETPAEIGALQKIGFDLVGMSTAFEARFAKSFGMEVAAISCVTNLAAGLEQNATLHHQDVLQVAQKGSTNLLKIIAQLPL
ncbi:MAG: purine-nucleoside phosphorylase [Zavarzinella sp.]